MLSRSPKARPLHPPHYKPRGVQWRYTKHGLPITLIEVRSWFPERAGAEETATHAAYMMEHYIRRMPQHRGARVTRCCLLLDMRGFRPATLPYVRTCIEILRRHYPGRLGAACFYDVPPYFVPVWKINRRLGLGLGLAHPSPKPYPTPNPSPNPTPNPTPNPKPRCGRSSDRCLTRRS